MASTPFFFLSGLLFLAWFTADVHSVKVIDVLKGSSVVLSPVEAVTSITSITWKHGNDLAVDWFGGDPTFYNIFNNTCSLNTTTGELTINNVRPEHSGVYTPDINGKTRSAMKLRVLSPVPKPTISHDCVPGKTKCTLTCTLTCNLTCSDTCKIDRTGDLGDVEVYWILDDRHRENGPELPITKDTKTETFICSLKNSVSFQNSAKLKNPFLPSGTGVPVWKPVVITLASLVSVVLLGFLCRWIHLKHRRHRIKKIIKEIRETMPVTEHDRILKEIHTSGPVTDVDLKLVHADWMILCILREGDGRNLSADSILRLLTARYLILWILQQRYEVQKSLDKVKDIIEKYFRGKQELNLSEDEKQKLQNVDVVIGSILMKEKLKLYEEEKQKLVDFTKKISTIIKSDDEVGQRSLNAASNDTSRSRDPAEEPLNSSSSRFEAVVPV